MIGHAVHNDFSVMKIHFPQCHIRDTSKFKPLAAIAKLEAGQGLSLKNLSLNLLGKSLLRPYIL